MSMKIRELTRLPDDYGEGERFVLEVDGDVVIAAGGGEPEDNNLSRDLNFVFQIAGLMRRAYEAGKRGEPFEFESGELPEEE